MISASKDMCRFKPSESVKDYRSALGRFATGITVVTALGPDGPVAITVNSFASVSLNPPLILWSPNKNSKRHDFFVNATHFIVHVLAAEQRQVCEAFARSAYAFDVVTTRPNEHDIPIIDGCLAVFECNKFAAFDAGDHTVLLGEVENASHRSGEALVFANGAYREIPAARAHP